MECPTHDICILLPFFMISPFFATNLTNMPKFSKLLSTICLRPVIDSETEVVRKFEGCCQVSCSCNRTPIVWDVKAGTGPYAFCDNLLTAEYLVNIASLRKYLLAHRSQLGGLIINTLPVIPACQIPTEVAKVMQNSVLSPTLTNYTNLINALSKLKITPRKNPITLAMLVQEFKEKDPKSLASLEEVCKIIKIMMDYNVTKKSNSTSIESISPMGRLRAKDGVLRGNILVKRTTDSCRAVSIPTERTSPYVTVFPGKFADMLMKMNVNIYNLNELRQFASCGHVKWYAKMQEDSTKKPKFKPFVAERHQLEVGDIVFRTIMPGDYVYLGRYPTLNSNSIQVMSVQIGPNDQDGIRYGSTSTKAFAGDFDGDESNGFLPSGIDTRVEALFHRAYPNILMGDGHMKFALYFHECTSWYIMSKNWDRELTPRHYGCILRDVSKIWPEFPEILGATRRALSEHSGALRMPENSPPTIRLIFSALLPRGFNYEHGSCKIEDGLLVKGLLTSGIVGGGREGILARLHYAIGPKRTLLFIDAANQISHSNIEFVHSSIRYRDLGGIITDEFRDTVRQTLDRITEIDQQIDKVGQLRETLELENKIEEATRKAGTLATKLMKVDNALTDMIRSGGRGNEQNQRHMTLSVLQLYTMSGQRPHLETMPPYVGLKSAVTRGFIGSSYVGGLSPSEVFACQTVARESVAISKLSVAANGEEHRHGNATIGKMIVDKDGAVFDGISVVSQLEINPNCIVQTRTGPSVVNVRQELALLRARRARS